jgi:hypothetical protein
MPAITMAFHGKSFKKMPAVLQRRAQVNIYKIARFFGFPGSVMAALSLVS